MSSVKLYRDCMESYYKSMLTVQEMDSLNKLRTHLIINGNNNPFGDVTCVYEGNDNRNGWSTYRVLVDGVLVGYATWNISEGEAGDAADVLILMQTIDDLVGKLMYYDRKEDETLPLGKIDGLIKGRVVTKKQIVDRFASALEKSCEQTKS